MEDLPNLLNMLPTTIADETLNESQDIVSIEEVRLLQHIIARQSAQCCSRRIVRLPANTQLERKGPAPSPKLLEHRETEERESILGGSR